jgi:peroxiredoxin 1
MSSGNDKIRHPVPNFQTTAVMPNDQFKDISPSDHKGKTVLFFL